MADRLRVEPAILSTTQYAAARLPLPRVNQQKIINSMFAINIIWRSRRYHHHDHAEVLYSKTWSVWTGR